MDLFRENFHEFADNINQRVMASVNDLDVKKIVADLEDELVGCIVEFLRLDVSFKLSPEKVTQLPSGVDQHYIVFEMGYSGNPEILRYYPSAFEQKYVDNNPYSISVSGLLFRFAKEGRSASIIKVFFQRDLEMFQGNIDRLIQEMKLYNQNLLPNVTSAIQHRKSEIMKHDSFVLDLGFQVKRREDAPKTFKVPDVRRKPAISKQKKSPSQEPEPVLSDDDYEHILNVIKQMTIVMEKSPSAFIKMKEEHLRMHFLVQLNGQFEVIGNALAEVFSSKGKTDIYIERDGKNIFIAECAFWKGQANFQEKVEQLLGYLTWRDTKTAILIFNKKGSHTAVMEKINETIPQLKNFVSDMKYGEESSVRFKMRREDDCEREIIVTILVFEIPT